MKTIEEEKQQSFDNFAIVCAIASESIDDKKIPFEAGWNAAIEFAQRWIPVEEELPEMSDDIGMWDYSDDEADEPIKCSDYVLIKDNLGDVYSGTIDENGIWIDTVGNDLIATHWRPIELIP